MRWLTLVTRLWLLRPRFLVAAARLGELGPSSLESPDAERLVFRLRHVHGVDNETHALVLQNVSHGASSPSRGFLSLRTKRVRVYRPKSHNDMLAGIDPRLSPWLASPIDWDEGEVEGPDVTDRETLLTLAKMTSNAYYDSPDTGNSEWYNLGDKWNVVRSLSFLRRLV